MWQVYPRWLVTDEVSVSCLNAPGHTYRDITYENKDHNIWVFLYTAQVRSLLYVPAMHNLLYSCVYTIIVIDCVCGICIWWMFDHTCLSHFLKMHISPIFYTVYILSLHSPVINSVLLQFFCAVLSDLADHNLRTVFKLQWWFWLSLIRVGTYIHVGANSS